MSWLSKLSLRGAGSRAGRAAAPPTVVTADPETCLMVFQNHWAQVSGILRKSELRSEMVSVDDVIAVRNYTDQMMYLLADERPPDVAAMGPILELVVVDSVLEKLLHWSLCRGLSEDSKVQQLKLYDVLVSQSHQPLLRHKPILTPLMRLLSVCSEPSSPPVENQLVLLLNQICVSLAKEPSTLELFLYTRTSQSPSSQSPSSQSPSSQSSSSLLLFSILVPFIHREGLLGQQARDALLLLMAISADNHIVASFIADNSYFCPVLATGLSALYSSLPRKIEVRGDDWHALRREDWLGVSSLTLFMNSLEFCNAVIQVAHPLVRNQLVDYLHNGFLVPVMGPALHKTSIEEMIASTAYLDLFLRSITERVLLQTFLRFLLLHQHDNSSILDTLISRVNSNSRLCMVSLSLFRTLLNLSCEDIMLQLVLRYLIPCNHVMLSQRCAVKDQDFYGKAANKFLSLIPVCCRPERGPGPEREEEHAVWAKGHGSPSVDTSSVTAAVPKPSTPSRLAFFMRQQSPSSESGHGHRSPSLGSCDRPSLASPLHSPSKWEEVSELEANYLEYLQEARCNIDQCVRACRVWSAPYDGKRPDPSSFPPPPISDCGSISLCTDHFGCGRGAASPEGRRRPRREELENGDWDPQASHSGSTPRNNKRSAVLAHGLDPGQGHGKGQLNGTGGKDRTRPELRPVERGECCLLVKKVRRDSGAQSAAPQGRRREAAQDISKQRPAEEPETGQWEGAAGGQSVDSLIDELLEKAPAEHNGSHLNVESFTRELSDMEASMRQRARHQEPTDPPAHTLLPSDEEEEEEEEQGFSSPACAPQVPSHAQPIQSAHTQPFTGPFIAVLFAKLDNMLQNSLYVNFLLTGIIAQLACYPQPLLRSFLLNTNMVFQPTVKSLIQVLGSVKNKIELFAGTQEDFPTLLFKARKYLIARGKLDWTDSPGTVPPLRRSDTLVRSRKPSLGELILRHTHSPTRARQAAQHALKQVREGQVLHALTGSSMFKSSAEKQNEALRVKNAVYCAVIFTEFLKELAAIAQEHSVTSPFLLEGSEE